MRAHSHCMLAITRLTNEIGGGFCKATFCKMIKSENQDLAAICASVSNGMVKKGKRCVCQTVRSCCEIFYGL